MNPDLNVTQLNNNPKIILFLTGTRADFGKIKPLIRVVEDQSEFEAHIFVTGMHMLSRYGQTELEVKRAGFKNIFNYFNQIHSMSDDMDLVLANTIQGLGYYVREYPPDLIVVHGDRSEALAGALVGSLNNILVAHIEGGELSGTIDELIRHSVSKLSHLHFVANKEAHHRLIQMGERDESIFVIGSPDIDVMLSDNLPDIDKVKTYYEIPFSEYAIFIYHPVTTSLTHIRKNIEGLMQALKASQLNFVVIYPNNDPGSDVILDTIIPYQEDPRFRILPSMRFEYFLTLLKNSRAIIGNSSAGIREAPVYGVPTINIGSRQLNRLSSSSVIHTSENPSEVLEAINNLELRCPPFSYYGQGNSAQLFVEHLLDSKLWCTSRQKQFQDVKFSLSSDQKSPSRS